MSKVLPYILLAAIIFACAGSSLKTEQQETQVEKNVDAVPYGYYKAKKWIYKQKAAWISDSLANACIGKQLTIDSLQLILFGDTFKNATYTIQKNKADDYITSFYDPAIPRDIGITTDSIFIIRVEPNPDDEHSPSTLIDIIWVRGQVVIHYKGYFFAFEKTGTMYKVLPQAGDTVRCLYKENNTCTGFMIQGTRKSGKVIHVNPTNKNVPLEVE